MKINRNMSAVVANRQLLRTENKLSLSMGRLSSGYKINKAGDNPAGMAISSKMKAQIDGLDQAEANSDDGQSVLRIADGALNEVSNMLQRIRELSVQAANGTNSYSDRQSIQDEIDQLTQEVDRISTDTEYNKKTLLDGSANTRVYVSGTHQDKTKFARSATRIDFSEEVLPGDYTVKVKTPAKQAAGVLLSFTPLVRTPADADNVAHHLIAVFRMHVLDDIPVLFLRFPLPRLVIVLEASVRAVRHKISHQA